MKILLIVVVVGLLVFAGLAVANAIDADEPVDEGSLSCDGGCSAGQVCSNNGCGARVGKSCDCGK